MTTKVTEWKEVSRKEAYKKYSRKIEEVIFELPDGKKSDYYIKKEGPASCVLAITKDNQVILAKQYRPGPKAVLQELPGGYVDPNEDPKETMARELLEETGYAGEIEFVTTCLDDAYSTMVRHCFVAKNCTKVAEPEPEKNEFIEIVLLPLAQFRKNLKKGQMTDVEVGYLCLDYLNLL